MNFCILNGFEVVAVWQLDLADGGCSKDRELVQSMIKTETFFFFFFNLNNKKLKLPKQDIRKLADMSDSLGDN